MAAHPSGSARPRNSALKDSRLTYRACTPGYAESLQLISPAQLVGQTDFDFLSDRSAALVYAAEKRVLESGIPEITAGEILSKRTAGKYFVRSPVLNSSGEITGIEIAVVSIDDLHRSYQLLLGTELQLRDVINQSPFGLLIHRHHELIYVNASWLELMGSAGVLPSKEEIKKLVEGTHGDFKLIRSVNAADMEQDLRLQSRAIKWNGGDATAVYCVPGQAANALLNESSAATNDTNAASAGFIEKRSGHRRTSEIPEQDSKVSSGQSFEIEFFDSARHPILICNNWVPLRANAAASSLLKKTADNSYETVASWFSDKDRARVEAVLHEARSAEDGVTVSLHNEASSYHAFISAVHKEGNRLAYITLLPKAESQLELDLSVTRLKDYVSAAADFWWEMDNQYRMTHLSMEMKDFLGVETAQLLNVPLESLITRHVSEDDQAEWKVLVVDLNKHLPFRDREYLWQHKDGEKRVVRLSGVPVFNSEEQFVGYRGIGWDCTARYHSASIVAYHASHDSLTGLVNRREFESRCDDAIARAADARQVLCFIDLDNFKRVNDSAGHLAGDELLRQLSALFTSLVRKSDVLARLGGDEFGLLIYDVGLQEAMRLTTQLRAEVESFQFDWEGQQFSVGASIGLVMIDEQWTTRSALFGAADAACYEAKHRGRNQVAVYDQAQGAGSRKRDVSSDQFVKSAIEQRKVKLAMQRIVSCTKAADSGSGVEILMRVPSPDGALLLPAAVIPLAERYGLSIELDKIIVELTLDWLQCQPHVADGLDICCINLSGLSVSDKGFLEFLKKALSATAVDTSILCFEVSESAVSTTLTAVSQFMEEIAEFGCKFSIDDFSGSINSFNYLKKLPVSFVKINRKLVRAVLDDPVHYTMVRSINEVAQTLGKQTIAESVESADVLAKLRELGVDMAQGYYISAPELIDF